MIFSLMHYKNMLASILFFFIGFVSMAQDMPQPPAPPPPPGLPIDDGLVALFMVALIYGAMFFIGSLVLLKHSDLWWTGALVVVGTFLTWWGLREKGSQ